MIKSRKYIKIIKWKKSWVSHHYTYILIATGPIGREGAAAFLVCSLPRINSATYWEAHHPGMCIFISYMKICLVYYIFICSTIRNIQARHTKLQIGRVTLPRCDKHVNNHWFTWYTVMVKWLCTRAKLEWWDLSIYKDL
jgi:hypothetical protein